MTRPAIAIQGSRGRDTSASVARFDATPGPGSSPDDRNTRQQQKRITSHRTHRLTDLDALRAETLPNTAEEVMDAMVIDL
jgi:hypothetical protein